MKGDSDIKRGSDVIVGFRCEVNLIVAVVCIIPGLGFLLISNIFIFYILDRDFAYF